MPPKSTIAMHPSREAIEMAILRGEPVRNIAARHGVTPSAVQRHKKKLPVSMAKVQEFQEEEAGSRLVRQVHQLTGRALIILAQAEAENDRKGALAAMREVRHCVELIGKATGEFEPQAVSPAFSMAKMFEQIDERREAAATIELMPEQVGTED